MMLRHYNLSRASILRPNSSDTEQSAHCSHATHKHRVCSDVYAHGFARI